MKIVTYLSPVHEVKRSRSMHTSALKLAGRLLALTEHNTIRQTRKEMRGADQPCNRARMHQSGRCLEVRVQLDTDLRYPLSKKPSKRHASSLNDQLVFGEELFDGLLDD